MNGRVVFKEEAGATTGVTFLLSVRDLLLLVQSCHGGGGGGGRIYVVLG